MDKAKMLTQNLKMNNQLRQKVISNKIAPEALVKLSNMEMSKPEVLVRRAKQLAEDNVSIKTDIMDVAREKIMKKLSNGIQWNGIQWNGIQWNGIQWNGIQWNGIQWNGIQWNGIQWNGIQWNGIQWNGIQWNE
jgi:hypothetical protein